MMRATVRSSEREGDLKCDKKRQDSGTRRYKMKGRKRERRKRGRRGREERVRRGREIERRMWWV